MKKEDIELELDRLSKKLNNVICEVSKEINKLTDALGTLKEKESTKKFDSFNYIHIVYNMMNKWEIFDNHKDFQQEKFIHKNHKNILDAYLKDASVEIEVYDDNSNEWNNIKDTGLDDNWVIGYRDGLEYRLEQQYPIFKRSKGTGTIFKFTDLRVGEVVYDYKNKFYKYGHKASYFAAHTDKDVWEDVAYDKEKELYDKQPVFCYDNDDIGRLQVRFYDVKNKRSFTYDGFRSGSIFDNYIPCKFGCEYLNKWVYEAMKKLGD